MSLQARQQVNDELALIDRFADAYRQRFSALIQELNADITPQTGRECLRLCVEAVNMLLQTQQQLATVLRSMSRTEPPAMPARDA